MGLDGYPQDLLEFMKLLKTYIAESGNNRKFRKTSGKEQKSVYFAQNQDKYRSENKNKSSKV